MSEHQITSIEQLEALYGLPAGAAVLKEIDHINAQYRAFIEAAPFFALATAGPAGLDCSPRGDAPGLRAHSRREDAAGSRPARQ